MERTDGKAGGVAAAVEAKAAAVVESAFLSPRVVDAATLAEFAGSFRALLEQVAQAREELRRSLEEHQATIETLDAAAARAGERLRPAAKLLPLIDEKLAAAEAALARARVAEQAAGEAALAPVAERARVLEARLAKAAERAEEAVAALEAECRARLEAGTGHARDVLGALESEIDARAEAMLARAGAALDARLASAEDLERRTEEAERRAMEAEARVAAAEERSAAAEGRLEALERRLTDLNFGAGVLSEVAERADRARASAADQKSAADGQGAAQRAATARAEARSFVRVDRPREA